MYDYMLFILHHIKNKNIIQATEASELEDILVFTVIINYIIHTTL